MHRLGSHISFENRKKFDAISNAGSSEVKMCIAVSHDSLGPKKLPARWIDVVPLNLGRVAVGHCFLKHESRFNSLRWRDLAGASACHNPMGKVFSGLRSRPCPAVI